MESTTMANKLWHIVQVVYYMLRKSMSKRKLMMDLHLLLKRGKIASKALGKIMTSHHNSNHIAGSFSCRHVDPNLSFYEPGGEVEFSCSKTPSLPSITKRKNRGPRRDCHYYEAAAEIAKAVEMLNSDMTSDADMSSVGPSPMKTSTPVWRLFGKSPKVVRQLRITDSQFPIKDDVEVADCRVDREAEEFIKKFYDQLRQQQQSFGATPDN